MARLFTLSESKYYLMALDAGTGSIRAVIFDLEGNQIAVGQAEWRHLAVPDVPGSMEFFHQWQKPENAWFAGNGRTHQTRKSMNFIRIHAISGRQFIRISWGWLIMD